MIDFLDIINFLNKEVNMYSDTWSHGEWIDNNRYYTTKDSTTPISTTIPNYYPYVSNWINTYINYDKKGEDKMENNKIINTYISLLKETFEKYKKATIKELESIKINDDGSMYKIKSDDNDHTASYWISEYVRLREELYSLGYIQPVSISKPNPKEDSKSEES